MGIVRRWEGRVGEEEGERDSLNVVPPHSTQATFDIFFFIFLIFILGFSFSSFCDISSFLSFLLGSLTPYRIT